MLISVKGQKNNNKGVVSYLRGGAIRVLHGSSILRISPRDPRLIAEEQAAAESLKGQAVPIPVSSEEGFLSGYGTDDEYPASRETDSGVVGVTRGAPILRSRHIRGYYNEDGSYTDVMEHDHCQVVTDWYTGRTTTHYTTTCTSVTTSASPDDGDSSDDDDGKGGGGGLIVVMLPPAVKLKRHC